MLDVVVNSIRLSDDNIYAQLKRIVQMAEEGQTGGNVDQVGILTGARRNVWAAARRILAQGIFWRVKSQQDSSLSFWRWSAAQ